MFLKFFDALRQEGVPATLREYLQLLSGLEAGLADLRIDSFYFLARTCLVKDERYLDRFDRVFATTFGGLESLSAAVESAEIPEEWLRKLAEKHLTEAEKAEIAALGWDKLMETLRARLAEQKGRHQGGSKWIGTGGTSPFGAHGYHPEGVRIGQEGNRNFRAVKVWDRREFRDFDETRELGTRNLKMALRRLRRFARTGAADELDLDGTIRETAHRGYLDVRLRPERRNRVKVLLLFDVGGSMDWHIEQVEALFAAAHGEFRHMASFYFHNCLYESVWRSNVRRHAERFPTAEMLRTYPPDTKLIFVGDASMSPYEISMRGGSVEHMNEEPGALWLERATATFKSHVWLNPVPEAHWPGTQSIDMVRRLMEGAMFPLTLEGLNAAMARLTH